MAARTPHRDAVHLLPVLVSRQVKAERAAALARDATQTLRSPSRRLTDDDIRALITALGNLRDVIRDAEPAEKAAIYDQLDLKVTFKPGEAKIRAEVTIGPENYAEHAEQRGIRVVSEGGHVSYVHARDLW